MPDFRNLGVLARVLVGVNAIALLAALMGSSDLVGAADRFMASAVLVEPILLASIVALYALSGLLGELPYRAGCAVVIALVAALCVLFAGWRALAGLPPSGSWRMAVLGAIAAAGLLGYFRLLARAYSPALAEARLQILQSRIRPHFLFNSMNAVLSLIRRDPRRAERALEDLADLFRTLMSDARSFVRLADEIALLERYAAIEQLRLGERLRITWELDAAPSDALLPPLVLQPLLENAVYHGVEPSTGSADVLVRIERRGNQVLARIENSRVAGHEAGEEAGRRGGNRMALENIRERLALYFDAEARLTSGVEGERYCVEISLPYRTQARREAPAKATA